MRTRYAPTPSGYLHEGNAAHFLVVARLAREQDADIVLRIDDIDVARIREEYLHDIFDLLDWLDLSWELGPQSAAEQYASGQTTRLDLYRGALTALHTADLVYACECSRADWIEYSGQSCPRGCRGREIGHSDVSFRLHVPELVGIADPVVWRRDDLPAYQLTSVVDDDYWNIDLVVRGADLRDSTAVQMALSTALPGSTFRHATVVHHALALDARGSKLSKSSGNRAEPLARTEEVRSTIRKMAEGLYETLVTYRPRSSGN